MKLQPTLRRQWHLFPLGLVSDFFLRTLELFSCRHQWLCWFFLVTDSHNRSPSLLHHLRPPLVRLMARFPSPLGLLVTVLCMLAWLVPCIFPALLCSTHEAGLHHHMRLVLPLEELIHARHGSFSVTADTARSVLPAALARLKRPSCRPPYFSLFLTHLPLADQSSCITYSLYLCTGLSSSCFCLCSNSMHPMIGGSGATLFPWSVLQRQFYLGCLVLERLQGVLPVTVLDLWICI